MFTAYRDKALALIQAHPYIACAVTFVLGALVF